MLCFQVWAIFWQISLSLPLRFFVLTKGPTRWTLRSRRAGTSLPGPEGDHAARDGLEGEDPDGDGERYPHNQVHANDDCQLVFTTHENDIMSYEYFRRDEIWFVERDEEDLSRLHPLDDFAADGARSDARLNKKYLEGRYGGVPVIDLSRARAALKVREA